MFVAFASTRFGRESRPSPGSYKPFRRTQHIWQLIYIYVTVRTRNYNYSDLPTVKFVTFCIQCGLFSNHRCCRMSTAFVTVVFISEKCVVSRKPVVWVESLCSMRKDRPTDALRFVKAPKQRDVVM